MNEDGGPAFPFALIDASKVTQRDLPGMSLRDWFAGQALAGWLASFGEDQAPTAPYENQAKLAYGLADAMLAERLK